MPLSTRQNPANLAEIIFTLCVNFLMYVVLILAFYMLVRFYLEEDAEFDDNHKDYAALSNARSGTKAIPSEKHVDDSDGLLEGEAERDSEVKRKSSTQGAAGGSVEMSSFASSIEIEESAQNRAIAALDGSRLGGGGGGSVGMKKMGVSRSKQHAPTDSESEVEADADDMSAALKASGTGTGTRTGAVTATGAAGGSFLNLNEWGEPDGTREEVVQRAIFCAIGLNVTFCIWGVLQERMLTMPYNGDFFEYSYGLVFMSRLGGLVMSALLVYHYKVVLISSPLWEYSFPSVANMLSSWCQYEALKYVSFPTQMLAKAFKMVPTMLMGTFMHNKTYDSYEYVSAALVALGLYLFLNSSETIDFKENVFGDSENVTGAWCGVVLLCLFLAFDSFTGQWQARMFQIHKQMSPLQMMLLMNGFSSVFSFITLVHQEELTVSLKFVYEHPAFFWHLILFTITANIGQLFIFYTVKNFGAVVFSIIMSLRILLSTLLSCFLYDHSITELGVVGIMLVFGALGFRIQKKTQGKPLIRWKDRKRSSVAQTKKVFSEWHENMDDC